MDGYIKLHRKIFENKYYFKEKFTYSQAWIDLILLAADKDDYTIKRNIRIMLKRGQVAMSTYELAGRWKWSRAKVVRFTNALQTEQKIVLQNNNITTLISIVKYDIYQTGDTTNGTTSETANSTTKNTPKARPSSYTLATEIMFPDQQPRKTVEEAVIWPTFDDFWHEYDKKVGRPKAEPRWNTLSQIQKEKVMAYIPLYKKAQPDKQYRQKPENFFKNKTWNDELITATNGTTINKQQSALENFLKPQQ